MPNSWDLLIDLYSLAGDEQRGHPDLSRPRPPRRRRAVNVTSRSTRNVTCRRCVSPLDAACDLAMRGRIHNAMAVAGLLRRAGTRLRMGRIAVSRTRFESPTTTSSRGCSSTTPPRQATAITLDSPSPDLPWGAVPASRQLGRMSVTKDVDSSEGRHPTRGQESRVPGSYHTSGCPRIDIVAATRSSSRPTPVLGPRSATTSTPQQGQRFCRRLTMSGRPEI